MKCTFKSADGISGDSLVDAELIFAIEDGKVCGIKKFVVGGTD